MFDACADESVESQERGEKLVLAAEVEEDGFDGVGFAGFLQPGWVGEGAFGDFEAGRVEVWW